MSSLIHTLRVIEQIDSPRASGERIAALFAPYLTDATVTVTPPASASSRCRCSWVSRPMAGAHGGA